MKQLLELLQLLTNNTFALVFTYCAPMIFVAVCFWMVMQAYIAPIQADIKVLVEAAHKCLGRQVAEGTDDGAYTNK